MTLWENVVYHSLPIVKPLFQRFRTGAKDWVRRVFRCEAPQELKLTEEQIKQFEAGGASGAVPFQSSDTATPCHAKAPGRWCHHDQRWHEGGKIMWWTSGNGHGDELRVIQRKHAEMFQVSKIVQVFGWVNHDEMLPGRTDRHIWRWQTCQSARCRPGWNTFRRSPRIKLRSLTFGPGPNRMSQMAFHWDLHEFT